MSSMKSKSRLLYLTYLTSLTFSSVQMVLYTTIPYISDTTGVLTSNIIGAIGIGSLIFSMMGPFWATRSDKLGRARVLRLGILGMIISFGLLSSLFIFNGPLSVSSKTWMVYLSRILYGLLASAVIPVIQAWQLDITEGQHRVETLTKNSMFLNLGRILGPVLILLQQVNFELVIYVASLWLTVLGSVFLFVSAPASTLNHQQPPGLSQVLQSWKRSIQESLPPILLALVFAAFIGILHSYLGHHIKTVLSITGQQATLLFAQIILGLSLFAVLVQSLGLKLLKSNWKIRALIGASSMVIGALFMMTATSLSQIWVSVAFIAISTGFIPPVYLALTSHSSSESASENIYGKKLGLSSVAHSLGYSMGMGLIALAMKLHLISESLVVVFVSVAIMAIASYLVRGFQVKTLSPMEKSLS